MAYSTRRCKKICEDKETNNATTNSIPALAQNNVASAAVCMTLPAEMFYQIFRNVDKKSLKNSREVCTTWRSAIDDNSKLIKTLTFTIVDITRFMNSQLASKVKSIQFIQPLIGTVKSVEDFFKKIGSTVEEVFFNFGEPPSGRRINLANRRSRQKLMFSMMLRYCTKLNSLTITSADMNYYFIIDCDEDPRNWLSLSMVKTLSVNVRTYYLNDLRKFVLSLPNLHRLDLNCGDMDDLGDYSLQDHNELSQQFAQRDFPNVVLHHLEQYNGKLQEIWLEDTDDLDGINLIKLLLSVGQVCPNSNFPNIKCKANLLDFMRFDKSNDSSIQVNKNNCGAIQSGMLQVCDAIIDESLETSRIGLCSNISMLEIVVLKRIPLANLRFISELTKLDCLRIDDFRRHRYPYSEEEDNFLRECFSFGVPLVKRLELDSDCCRLGVNSLPFHSCFPNLTKLSIKNYYGDLSTDFIHNLTNLDQLRSLTLENIEELTDEHLIRKYDFAEEDGKISNLPAIAGFKSLKSLHIAVCSKLANKSLRNGLALCNRLEKIKLCYIKSGRGRERPGKFTNTGFNFLKKARNFVVEDQDITGFHVLNGCNITMLCVHQSNNLEHSVSFRR